jgi:hypothetical protein
MKRDEYNATAMSHGYEHPSVVFTETGEKRAVRGWCAVCVKREAYGTEVVSPSGLMHIGMDGGFTRCGKNATFDGWWWSA